MTRILANMGVGREGVLLANMEAPLPERAEGQTRWLTGLYLDEPVKLDDPYRYYRW